MVVRMGVDQSGPGRRLRRRNQARPTPTSMPPIITAIIATIATIRIVEPSIMPIACGEASYARNASSPRASSANVNRTLGSVTAKLPIGIGLNSGTVVVDNVGGAGRLESSVIGDAVNVAARAEAATRIAVPLKGKTQAV